MKTNIIVAVISFFVLVLADAGLSMAEEESKEWCTLGFSITGAKVDIEIFNARFTKTGPYKQSECTVTAVQQVQPDDRLLNAYICYKPNNHLILEATRSFELVLMDNDNANRREKERPRKHGLLLDNRPLLASVNDPANILAQGEPLGSPKVDFQTTAATCKCGTSGPCRSGGAKCSTSHPDCPACPP